MNPWVEGVALAGAALRVATPLIYAALGETLVERSGVLNLGIEGTMMLGALVGFWAAHSAGGLAAGVAAALIAGAAAGLLMALLAVRWGLNQHVSGLGITLLASGLSLYLYRLLFGGAGLPSRIEPFSRWTPPAWVGTLAPLFNQYGLTFVALALVPAAWWLVYRTPWGLGLRAVGENPYAADVAGVNVFRVRTVTLAVGGALMAMGGAFLSLAQLGSFTPGIIAGRGWVAIALVIFGHWRPGRVLAGALLFGGVDALQLRLQAEGLHLPYQVLLALPYLATIVALAAAGRQAEYPAALLRPYRREG